MLKFLALAALASAGVSDAAHITPTEPVAVLAAKSQCGPDTGSLEIPACTVVKAYDDFEVRSYQDGLMWATTIVNTTDYKQATGTGFGRLFSYISGANVGNVTVEMTGPVRAEPMPDAASPQAWMISFFVPSKFATEGDVPVPTDPTVSIAAPSMSYKAVSKNIGGFPKQADYEKHLSALVTAVDGAGLKRLDAADVTYSGYSSPFSVVSRHQEVWLDVAPPSEEQ